MLDELGGVPVLAQRRRPIEVPLGGPATRPFEWACVRACIRQLPIGPSIHNSWEEERYDKLVVEQATPLIPHLVHPA